MEPLSDRIARLPPEKRALLELKLQRQRTANPPVEQQIGRRSGNSSPLSFAQERIWFLDQLEPESSFYNLPLCVSLNGSLNLEALEKALDGILSRHEALRTIINVADGEPSQVVSLNNFSLPVIDLSGYPDSEIQERTRQILDAEVRRPFDLSRDLMLRATLLKVGLEKHILLLVTHHVAFDGWSWRVLIREISTIYASWLEKQTYLLPELPIQCADFAIWQRQRLRGTLVEKQLSYWKQQLSGISVLQLPTDRPRPAIQTYRGAAESARFSGTLSEGLKSLSRTHGATLFMTLLAAFQTLLCFYSGQEDIAIGSPIAGRVRPETEGLIGVFINMLVLRGDLSGNPLFSDLLKRVRSMTFNAYENQELPFEELVKELHPTRDLSRSALFQVMFAYQNIPRQKLVLPGLAVHDVETHKNSANYDLSLYAANESEGLIATLEYNSDLFDAATIKRMLGHFETLLQAIATGPDRHIAELPLLTQAERNVLLVDWNNTKSGYSDDKCLQHLVEAQVERSPNAVAVAFEGRQLTYRELNSKANQLANHLRKLGVDREVPVGLCLERSLEMVIGLVGILKAGGAYIPLDPAYPRDRLAYILQNSQVAVLLTQQSLLQPLPLSHSANVLCIDSDWDRIAQQGTENPEGQGSPEDLAYIIYTSGSTGSPKGVQIPHRAVVNFMSSMQRQLQLTQKDALLAVTTLSFDIAGLEMFLPLIAGARIELASHEDAMDGTRLTQKLSSSGITLMQATPATWRLLIESGWHGSDNLKILCGGEAMPHDLAKPLRARCSTLWNMYGPTETTIWSTAHRVEAEDKSISIGRPIHNTQIYVLDSNLQPVPIGIPGELCIGGVGVARGYLHLPELTSEKFIPDPFSTESGARLYKTGDLARYLPDGSLDLVGRIDHQIKIRGFRIEPGEIESTLTQCPGVLQAVVVTREDTPDEKKLVAYLTTRPESSVTTPEVTSFLKTKLPEYMLPSAFVLLNELPLTPNGKIDRRALPAPDFTRPASEKSFVPARNHLERQIANIWENVLGVRPVGVQDNFFDLGGYSLLAVRVTRQIEKVFGKKLPVTALFQLPTVEQLAQLLSEGVPLAPWSSLVPLQPKGSRIPFFWIHGESSDAILPRYLGTDQPLYGVLHQGHDGRPAAYTRVEDIAAHYLSEIRTVQPTGPYFLGGYCFGGMLAFEIAQQLRKQGDQVALLVLLTPSRLIHDVGAFDSLKKDASLPKEISRHLQIVAELSPRERLKYVLQRTKVKTTQLPKAVTYPIRKRVENLLWKIYLRLGWLLPPSLRSPYILQVYFKAIDAYQPEVYPGRVIIYRSTPMWSAITAGDTEVHEVPGNHTDILREPYVREWAEGLRSYLEQAQASTAASKSPLT